MIAASAGVGQLLIQPVTHSVGVAPPELRATAVQFPSAPGLVVSGWFARGAKGKGAILLLHGARADRRDMVARALRLESEGYSVLLIDLPAHGESTGAHVTFGLNEAEGVKAALVFLRRQIPGERIGVIGVSLGAASMVLAKPTPAPSAVVLESMYPTIAEAIKDRLVTRLGTIGIGVAPLLLWQLPIRLGISADQLRPIAEISKLGAPVLIISGSADQYTLLAETKRIFEAASEPKELWVVNGAAHVDLQAYDSKAYEAKVFSFLARHLHNGV